MDIMTNRVVLVSASGGKDSTACLLFCLERGLDFEVVHADTGWEHPATVRYVRETLPEHLRRLGHSGVITTVQAPRPVLREDLVEIAEAFDRDLGYDPSRGEYSPFVWIILHKAMFSSKQRRFCTSSLKTGPLRDHGRLRAAETGKRILSVVGIRHEESSKRALLPEFEPFDGDAETWRPLINWKQQDVVDIHLRNGVPPNPLYTMGADRVGCWPCIYARKAEVRMISVLSPERIDLIERLETTLERLQRERALSQGTTMEDKGHSRPAWFQVPRPETRIENGKAIRSGRGYPIRSVVRWAHTKRGSDDFEPFAPLPNEDGCVRWGVCDLAWTKGKA